MQQIYKVFINNFFILIVDESKSVNNRDIFQKVYSDLELKQYLLSCNYCLDVNLLYRCKSPSSVFKRFKKQYQFLIAAGGVVKNKSNSILMIYKNAIWDLPKGKVDSGELLLDAAIREVYEETNVKELEILPMKYKTYHMYNISESQSSPIIILKETTWFLMQSKIHVKLIPQLDEGIVKVSWISIQKIHGIQTYESIRTVLRNLLLNFFNNGGRDKMF
jgi:8-oxo-dGTP pyrophosphatase MutT (NUDIX family)